MFIGAINNKLRRFFWEAAPLLDGRDIYVGCSGNFTIEQIITRRCPAARLYSNDVSIYSAVVGHAVIKREMKLTVAEPDYSWLVPYLEAGGHEQIAVFLLLTEMLKFEKRKTPFACRMWDAYTLYFEKRFNDTLERVKKALASIRVEEFTMVDVHDYYPKDGVAIGFLPTYVGGYEKLFKRFDEIFRWDAPAYALLTEERREETIRRMITSDYILYDDRPRPELPCVARAEQFGKKAVYIYSNLKVERGLYRRGLPEKVATYRLLGIDERLPVDAELSFLKTDNATINHYRNMFLKKGIETSAGDLCYLVFAAGRLFGFLIFKTYSPKGGDRDTLYLLSDFAAPSTVHRRLAKLLLLVLLTRELKTVLEEAALKRVKAVLTTAFTDKPVSMKYRGIFEMIKRGEGYLNYRAEFKDYTLKEAYALWMKKFEKQ